MRIPNRVWSDDVWRSAVSEGVASYLPQDLRYHLGEHYSQIAFMRDDTRATDLTAWRLRSVARTIQPDAATRTRMIEDIEEARGRFAEMAFVGNEIIGLVEDMKLAPPQAEVTEQLSGPGTLAFCREHALPLGKVVARHGL